MLHMHRRSHCVPPAASQFSYPSMQPLGATNITTTRTLVTALDFYRPEVARHIKALPLLSGEMLHLKCRKRRKNEKKDVETGLAASSRRWERVSSDMNTTMHNNKSNFCFVLEFHENKLHQKCVCVCATKSAAYAKHKYSLGEGENLKKKRILKHK